jgi:membrane-associated protease RseP (regulator of RpoE activity)
MLVTLLSDRPSTTLLILVVIWGIFYFLAKYFKLEEKGWVIQPYYALYKSTGLNKIIKKLALASPRFWKVFGNIGIAMSIGQASYLSYILIRNLYNFFFIPQQATPVQPLIPGVTISINSMPWFLLAAGFVILTHELSHGIQCINEGVPIKTSAILLAVVTFGGAVEPDEKIMNNISIWGKMRIFASGSLVNLFTGLVLIIILIFFGSILPIQFLVFFNWIYFLAINLSMMNMLPIGPLDGGQMWRTWTDTFTNGKLLQRTMNYVFLTVILGNIGLSLIRFGWVSI